MGRPRLFDTDAVVSAARDAFVRTGYAGTSIDDLLQATGLQRASLYSAFGSKRGLFLTTLRRPASGATADLDLLLVALMDLASEDAEVRETVMRILERVEGAPEILGRRILQRAGLQPVPEEGKNR
jgi:TetR/AcrR family transcriptional repressor of nem operon